jgi:hypothetical protein
VARPEIANIPKPAQIFELAGLCVGLGKTGKSSLRRSRSPANNVVFRTDFLSPPDQTYYDFIFDDTRSVSRRFFGTIAVVPYVSWKMQIKETNSLYQGADMIDECQIIHRFRWSGSRVIEATKLVRYRDMEEGLGESYQPEMLDNTAFQPDFLNAVNQVRRLQAEDCDRLIDDIQIFNAAIGYVQP